MKCVQISYFKSAINGNRKPEKIEGKTKKDKKEVTLKQFQNSKKSVNNMRKRKKQEELD